MGCLEDRKKYNSLEKNTELAQKFADEFQQPCVVFSINNGKAWSFKPINGVYEHLITPKKKVSKPKTKAKTTKKAK